MRGASTSARQHPRDPAHRIAGSLLVSASLLAAGLAAPARADAPRVRVELLAGGMHLDYVERGPTGVFLDGERGWLPALSGTVEVRGARAFLRAAASTSRGGVAYDGRVQSSNAALDGLPARSTSGARFLQGELQLGGWVDRGRALALYAGGGGRRWDRDIHGTTVVSRTGTPVLVSGLSEEYRWLELHAGVRWTLAPTRRTELELDVAAVRTVAPEMSVAWGGTEVALELGERTGWRAAVAYRRTLGARTFVSVVGSAEQYRFGASGVDARTRLLEPASETRSLGLRAGAGARF